MKAISNLKAFALDLLFPPRCLYCAKNLLKTAESRFLCHHCSTAIPILDAFSCIFCRGRLPIPKSHCHPRTEPVLAAMSLFHHDLVKDLIHQLKFKSRQSVVQALTPQITMYLLPLRAHFNDFLIVPIPLHHKRQKQRGFNQAELIARVVAGCLAIPMRPEALIRVRATKRQTEVKEKIDRKSNVAGAFAPTDANMLNGKKILLVDDVATSGATLIEAAQTLRRAGASAVVAFVLART